MRKILYILLLTSIIFSACKEEENNPDSPFIGYWSGNYSGDDDSGIWNGTISANGDINGTASSSSSDLPDFINLNGTVTNSGSFTAAIGVGSSGINFIGQLSGNSGNGTWSSTTNGWSGTWQGYNYNE